MRFSPPKNNMLWEYKAAVTLNFAIIRVEYQIQMKTNDKFTNQHSPFNHDVINRVAVGTRNLIHWSS